MDLQATSLQTSSLLSFFSIIYDLKKLKINHITIHESLITIEAFSSSSLACCPNCKKRSKTRRSSYLRKITALPIGEYSVMFHIRVYRYKCSNSDCDKKIFSEQYVNFATKYSRRTFKTSEYIKKVVLEMSSNKASYILKISKLFVSSSTCLRIIKSIPIEQPNNLNCIGIDDWAMRKGMKYGSIVVDSTTGKIIDLIGSRNEADVISWLNNNPGIKYVTRDRSSTYANAISKALPDAKQIADKFHLVKNLSDAITKDIKSEYKVIKVFFNENVVENTVIKIKENELKKLNDKEIYTETYQSRQIRYQLFQKLKKKGLNNTAIAKKTNTHRETVAKYLKDGPPIVKCKATLNYDAYLDEIYDLCAKQSNPSAIYREIKKKGFKGCSKSFGSWFNKRFPQYKFKWNRNYSIVENISGKKWVLPTFKKLSILIMNKDFGISKETGEKSVDRIVVDKLLIMYPRIKELQTIFLNFREAIKAKDISQLNNWYCEMENYNYSSVKRFAIGLKKDWNSILNVTKYKWTNSLVEGCVNKLKCKKREMYGRGGIELLRRKVCLSVTG